MIKIDNFIVCAFATQNTPYEQELQTKLIPSLEKFKIPYYIEGTENRGSWLKNVAMKPLVILHALEKYPNMNILSLDADCELLQYPALFNNIPQDYDIACHILNWSTWYHNGSDVKELLSGTMFLRNNDKIKSLVTQWYLETEKSMIWEQKCLEKVLKENNNIKLYELPIEYTYINTLPNGDKPFIECNPVVVHYQASRKYKKLIMK